jgi:hypothetical protein
MQNGRITHSLCLPGCFPTASSSHFPTRRPDRFSLHTPHTAMARAPRGVCAGASMICNAATPNRGRGRRRAESRRVGHRRRSRCPHPGTAPPPCKPKEAAAIYARGYPHRLHARGRCPRRASPRRPPPYTLEDGIDAPVVCVLEDGAASCTLNYEAPRGCRRVRRAQDLGRRAGFSDAGRQDLSGDGIWRGHREELRRRRKGK